MKAFFYLFLGVLGLWSSALFAVCDHKKKTCNIRVEMAGTKTVLIDSLELGFEEEGHVLYSDHIEVIKGDIAENESYQRSKLYKVVNRAKSPEHLILFRGHKGEEFRKGSSEYLTADVLEGLVPLVLNIKPRGPKELTTKIEERFKEAALRADMDELEEIFETKGFQLSFALLSQLILGMNTGELIYWERQPEGFDNPFYRIKMALLGKRKIYPREDRLSVFTKVKFQLDETLTYVFADALEDGNEALWEDLRMPRVNYRGEAFTLLDVAEEVHYDSAIRSLRDLDFKTAKELEEEEEAASAAAACEATGGEVLQAEEAAN